MSDPLAPDLDTPPPSAGAPAWMTTYADLMSLLLCFFVLLLSIANVDVRRFEQAAGSLRTTFSSSVEALNPQGAEASRFAPPIEAIASLSQRHQRDRQLTRDMTRRLGEDRLHGGITLQTTAHGVAIRVPGGSFFGEGNDTLEPESQAVLAEIAGLLRVYPHDLRIEGHTDDALPAGERFPSNWHLSSARAIAALRWLVEREGIDPRRLSATGFADTRPVSPNDTSDNRSRNRRLEFVFEQAASDAPAPSPTATREPAPAVAPPQAPSPAAAPSNAPSRPSATGSTAGSTTPSTTPSTTGSTTAP